MPPSHVDVILSAGYESIGFSSCSIRVGVVAIRKY
jgi:hypothetical protein